MKHYRFFLTVTTLLLALSMNSQAEPLARRFVSVPVWNIATDTLISMTPNVDGKRSDAAASAICALSRGEKTAEDITAYLYSLKMDQRNVTTLMDSPQASCVAWLATAQFLPVDYTPYLQTTTVEAPPTPPQAATKEKTGWSIADLLGTKKPVQQAEKMPKEVKTFNHAAFMDNARLQLATAQATAQLYAVIASNIGNQSEMGWPDYQQQVKRIVNEYAPNYLASIRHYYAALVNTPLTLEKISDNAFVVADTQGHQLERQQNQTILRTYGVSWMGEGKILGKAYYVNVNVLGPAPEPVVQSKKLTRSGSTIKR